MAAKRTISGTRLTYLLNQLRRRIWFRAALISAASLAIVGLSALASRYFPFEFDLDIGQDAVGTLLEIIASSMLAVTTFSITAMVTAYGSATQLATPRATQLMVSDTTSQNALSTFLGAFVFAVVGIIGLQTEIYGSQGRIVLFAGTVLMIVVVVLTLLRWISHLTTFGRMADVIDRVEDAAKNAMRAFAQEPYMGARPAIAVPAGARAVFAGETGYVNHIDIEALRQFCVARGVAIHVAVVPGSLVHPHRPILHLAPAGTSEREETQPESPDEERRALCAAFSIERHRAFDNDPRLGVIALSEIGSRALAPATNDPGTAIEVLNAMLRVLLLLPGAKMPDSDDEEARVYASRPTAAEFLEDAFAPMVREGTKEAEVAIRLTKTLAALRDHVPCAASEARRLAETLAGNVREGEATRIERERFAASHDPLWAE